MHRAPRLLLAFLLGSGVATVHPAVRLMASSTERLVPAEEQATLKPAAATSPDIPFRDYEFQVEQDLFELANTARQQAGVSPLKFDSGLSQAARVHALAMLEAGQLSHQFIGESSLPQRLANLTSLQLDQEGENVALDYDAE